MNKKSSFNCLFYLLITTLCFLLPNIIFADDIAIDRLQCWQEQDGSYCVEVKYQTKETWTDNIRFIVDCVFVEDEISFEYPEGEFINVERGWHIEEIYIYSNYKKRYGRLISVLVKIYQDDNLMDEAKCSIIRTR